MGLVLWVNFEDFEAAFGEAGGWRAARPGKAGLAGDTVLHAPPSAVEFGGRWLFLFFFFSPSLQRENKILCS